MDILGARRSIEQKLLMQSVGLMALVAVSGTIMGIVTGSSAVLLDGVFSFVDVVIKIMMLMTAKLIARETSKRFQFGYWQFEPLVLAVEGFFILLIVIYALSSGITDLISGGRHVDFGPAIYYAIFFTVADTIYYLYVRRINKSLQSNLIKFDNVSWYVDALLELYPACKAVVFGPSRKFLSRESIENYPDKAVTRFIDYAVNVRYFNIQGTDDMMVDSVGMSTLFLPDVQYHFHGINSDDVVIHAYNMLYFILENDNPVGDGDTISGLENGELDSNVQWILQYEDSLVQPVRAVLDVNMGEYASGTR